MERYKAVPGVEMTSFGNEYYLVKARKLAEDGTNCLLRMNEVSAFYWTLLGEWRTKEELLSELPKDYDVPDEGIARKDLDMLLDNWVRTKCLEVDIG